MEKEDFNSSHEAQKSTRWKLIFCLLIGIVFITYGIFHCTFLEIEDQMYGIFRVAIQAPNGRIRGCVAYPHADEDEIYFFRTNQRVGQIFGALGFMSFVSAAFLFIYVHFFWNITLAPLTTASPSEPSDTASTTVRLWITARVLLMASFIFLLLTFTFIMVDECTADHVFDANAEWECHFGPGGYVSIITIPLILLNIALSWYADPPSSPILYAWPTNTNNQELQAFTGTRSLDNDNGNIVDCAANRGGDYTEKTDMHESGDLESSVLPKAPVSMTYVEEEDEFNVEELMGGAASRRHKGVDLEASAVSMTYMEEDEEEDDSSSRFHDDPFSKKQKKHNEKSKKRKKRKKKQKEQKVQKVQKEQKEQKEAHPQEAEETVVHQAKEEEPNEGNEIFTSPLQQPPPETPSSAVLAAPATMDAPAEVEGKNNDEGGEEIFKTPSAKGMNVPIATPPPEQAVEEKQDDDDHQDEEKQEKNAKNEKVDNEEDEKVEAEEENELFKTPATKDRRVPTSHSGGSSTSFGTPNTSESFRPKTSETKEAPLPSAEGSSSSSGADDAVEDRADTNKESSTSSDVTHGNGNTDSGGGDGDDERFDDFDEEDFEKAMQNASDRRKKKKRKAKVATAGDEADGEDGDDDDDDDKQGFFDSEDQLDLLGISEGHDFVPGHDYLQTPADAKNPNTMFSHLSNEVSKDIKGVDALLEDFGQDFSDALDELEYITSDEDSSGDKPKRTRSKILKSYRGDSDEDFDDELLFEIGGRGGSTGGGSRSHRSRRNRAKQTSSSTLVSAPSGSFGGGGDDADADAAAN